jgi:hypothetical protein
MSETTHTTHADLPFPSSQTRNSLHHTATKPRSGGRKHESKATNCPQTLHFGVGIRPLDSEQRRILTAPALAIAVAQRIVKNGGEHEDGWGVAWIRKRGSAEQFCFLACCRFIGPAARASIPAP